MDIKIVVHESKAGFWAEVPGFPGCSTQGESLHELLHNVAEAIEAYRRDELAQIVAALEKDDAPNAEMAAGESETSGDGLEEEPAPDYLGEVVPTKVDLPAGLARFAEECVAEGRFKDVSAVVRSALAILEQREVARRELEATLVEAEAESDRDGYVSLEDALAAVDRVIDSHRR